MTRVRIYALPGAAVALSALAWSLAPVQAAFASNSDGSLFGPAVGEALLGAAMLAIGLVFRWAMTAPEPAHPAPVVETCREFREGFQPFPSLHPATRRRDRQGLVIELRRAAARSGAAGPAPALPGLGAVEIARLEHGLHARAQALRQRHVEQARRRFLRAGVDAHGHGPQ